MKFIFCLNKNGGNYSGLQKYPPNYGLVCIMLGDQTASNTIVINSDWDIIGSLNISQKKLFRLIVSLVPK